MSSDYRIDLKPHLVGEFNLAWLNLGYRYSPWKEEDGGFSHRCLCGGKVARVKLSEEGSRILLQIKSKQKLIEEEVEEIKRKVIYCLGLDDDLSELAEIAARDPHLRRASDALPGYRLKATVTVYEAILSAMISQNCSRGAFFSMLSQFRKGFGGGAEVDGERSEAFPTPSEVLRGEPEKIQDLRLRYRMKYIRDVARVLTDDFLRRVMEIPAEDGIAELKRLRGIGDYTARVVQLYGMRRYGVAFVDGYVQRLIGQTYLKREKPKPREVLQLVEEQWGSWQGYALDITIAYAQLTKSG